MKIKIYVFGSFFLLFSLMVTACDSSQKEDVNEYFIRLHKEITSFADKKDKISHAYFTKALDSLHRRELFKYKNSGDEKYKLSSKYIEIYYYSSIDPNTFIRQLPTVYELLKLNNNRYDYITIFCNFNLAYQFEHNSPELAMQFLDSAIETEKKSEKDYELPHMYHLKGRLYYNKKDYKKGMEYFDLALKTYKKDDFLYISSMHNNFGLCYEKMKRPDLAIREANIALDILNKIQEKNYAHDYFLFVVKGDLGYYQYTVKNYPAAQVLLTETLDFYKAKQEIGRDLAKCLRRLFDLYKETGNTEKMTELIDFIYTIEPQFKSIADKIEVNEIIQSYYAYTSNPKLKEFCYKLMKLHRDQDEQDKKNFADVSDVLNKHVIGSINQKHDFEIKSQKNRNKLLFVSIFALTTIFCIIFITVRNRNRKAKELAAKEKVILEKTKKILEQNIRFQDDKITNLHLNLNLKIETEKTFLEQIKKIKKSKNTNVEETVSDLFFKINNLIQIDKRNFELINESTVENKQFVHNLSEKFPALTKHELKFCVYYKLGLSSKEISVLENITEGSARVYKNRIKTKMNIGKESDLNDYLKDIKKIG